MSATKKKTPKRKGSKSTGKPSAKKSKLKKMKPPAGDAEFIACDTFSGAKAGYSFKKGGSGVGYYKDVAPTRVKKKERQKKNVGKLKNGTWADVDSGDDMMNNSDFVSLSGSKNEAESNVLYLGHIPHGFYEDEMKKFFSQFGELRRLRLSRSKKTGRSRGYAFLQFGDIPTAKTVALAMNKYILFGQTLVCHMVRQNKIHPKIFAGCDRDFKVVPWREIARDRHNKEKSAKQQMKNLKRLLRKDEKKRARLAKALGETGVDFAYSGYAEASKEIGHEE